MSPGTQSQSHTCQPEIASVTDRVIHVHIISVLNDILSQPYITLGKLIVFDMQLKTRITFTEAAPYIHLSVLYGTSPKCTVELVHHDRAVSTPYDI